MLLDHMVEQGAQSRLNQIRMDVKDTTFKEEMATLLPFTILTDFILSGKIMYR